jgi:hypothetical protein
MNTNEATLRTIKALASDSDRVQISEVVGVLAADNVSMADVHSALIALQDAGKVVLYRNDATRSITKGQHKSAVTVGGCPRHLVYLT